MLIIFYRLVVAQEDRLGGHQILAHQVLEETQVVVGIQQVEVGIESLEEGLPVEGKAFLELESGELLHHRGKEALEAYHVHQVGESCLEEGSLVVGGAFLGWGMVGECLLYS